MQIATEKISNFDKFIEKGEWFKIDNCGLDSIQDAVELVRLDSGMNNTTDKTSWELFGAMSYRENKESISFYLLKYNLLCHYFDYLFNAIEMIIDLEYMINGKANYGEYTKLLKD